MKIRALTFTLSALLVFPCLGDGTVAYEGKEGPGKGKHIVLISGDEEYRSEEGLPMLGKILSQRHGFKCSVLFSVDEPGWSAKEIADFKKANPGKTPPSPDDVDPDAGSINPEEGGSVTNSEALETADAIVMLLRFRHWPDAAMSRFEKAYLAGKPIIALRTSTHAFNFGKESPWTKWTWNNEKGGFGRMVLGETWVSHWGNHKHEATRGIIADSAKDDPILKGVKEVFGDTDVYEAAPPADAKILLHGQVLKGMSPTDPPAEPRKKKTAKNIEQSINEPMMPVAWTREHKNEAGKTNRVFCSTLGAATDLQNEDLRRLVVNSVYWGLGMEVPTKADVTYVGEFKPTEYGFGGYKRGVKPSEHELKP